MSSSGKTRSNAGTDLDLLLRDLARSPVERFMAVPLVLGGAPRFRVLRRLGAGGFGVVYLVRDLAAETDVALKTLPSGRPELIYRLKREFRTLADIDHENLVSFYELYADEDRCFFTMEYVPGCTFLRTELAHARGACAVAASLASRNEGERRALLEDALRSSASLERIGSRMARSLSQLLRAAIAAQERRADDAASKLEVAARELEEQEMGAYAAAARVQLARLRPGGRSSLDGEVLCDSEGFVRMLTPGFPST